MYDATAGLCTSVRTLASPQLRKALHGFRRRGLSPGTRKTFLRLFRVQLLKCSTGALVFRSGNAK
jgi:hypothetical protein